MAIKKIGERRLNMFTEREALKLRLEQLLDQEERFFKLFREERNIIFNRLSELDETDTRLTEEPSFKSQTNQLMSSPAKQVEEAITKSPKADKESLATLLDQVSKTFSNRSLSQPQEQVVPEKEAKPETTGKKRGRKPIVTPEKEAAINVLKENPRGMKGSDLQRAVEEATGNQIANMTTFMKSVENLDPNVQKPRRGMYKYRT